MLKPVLFVAAAVAILYWLSHTANAAEEVASKAAEEVKSPHVMVNFPLVCMDKKDLLRIIGMSQLYPVWHGIKKETFLTTLYLKEGGAWIMTEERAMSKTMCILSSGEQNSLLGIGGI